MGTYNDHKFSQIFYWKKIYHHFSYTFVKKKICLGQILLFELMQFAGNLVWTIPVLLF